MKKLTQEEKYLLACDRVIVTPVMLNNLSADTIKNLSADTIKNLSADTINNLSAYTINNLSADTINNLSAYTINNLSADTINNLSADTIKNLSADTINNLSADTINNLSADTIKNLSENKAWIELWERVPVIEKPYTKLLSDIQNKIRCHKQSTWGPIETIADFDANKNICETAMCTAGHLVNMAGLEGYKLKAIYGFAGAAALIHAKSCPGRPCQNFGSIPQDFALAYIETEAEFEASQA
jgi:hypothetical protein